MSEFAQAVISGCMEWSCNTRIGEISMFSIAERLRELGRTLHEFDEHKNRSSERERLRLLSNRSRQPQVVKIRMAHAPETAEYAELATLAYSDVPQDVENLGGIVALADTNRHHVDSVQGIEEGNGTTVAFRNAPALHFEEVQSPDSLVSLALLGSVSILSVKIGV